MKGSHRMLTKGTIDRIGLVVIAGNFTTAEYIFVLKGSDTRYRASSTDATVALARHGDSVTFTAEGGAQVRDFRNVTLWEKDGRKRGLVL